jgi:hypothetical protein
VVVAVAAVAILVVDGVVASRRRRRSRRRSGGRRSLILLLNYWMNEGILDESGSLYLLSFRTGARAREQAPLAGLPPVLRFHFITSTLLKHSVIMQPQLIFFICVTRNIL